VAFVLGLCVFLVFGLILIDTHGQVADAVIPFSKKLVALSLLPLAGTGFFVTILATLREPRSWRLISAWWLNGVPAAALAFMFAAAWLGPAV
jgi:hypothetical protein